MLVYDFSYLPPFALSADYIILGGSESFNFIIYFTQCVVDIQQIFKKALRAMKKITMTKLIIEYEFCLLSFIV